VTQCAPEWAPQLGVSNKALNKRAANRDGDYEAAIRSYATQLPGKTGSVVLVTVDGVTQSVADWARQLNVSHWSLRGRARERDGDYEAAIRSYTALPWGCPPKSNWVTVDGVTQCITDWARQLGIDVSSLRARASHRGGDYEAAIRSYVTKPHVRRVRIAVTVDGLTQYVADWARQLNVTFSALGKRARKQGGSYEAAIRSYTTYTNDNLPNKSDAA
jgi:hypothetical protein